MISLTKILNRLYLTKFSFYLLLGLILISFSITFYLMLPNNNLVKNPLHLQYFLNLMQNNLPNFHNSFYSDFFQKHFQE